MLIISVRQAISSSAPAESSEQKNKLHQNHWDKERQESE